MRLGLTVALLALAGCNSPDSNSAAPIEETASPGGGEDRAAPRWDLQTNGEGATLALLAADGTTAIRLICPAGANRLLVNIPAFRPIGSEERLSFGSGGEVVALVADPRGDAQKGGVSGAGPVPANLAALIGGPPSASYGAQTSGPHSAPPQDVARAFVAACAPGAPAFQPETPSAESVSACLMQGKERLRVAPLRAVGTEPFWGARIEGRCVTYSHPDDPKGTRIWTRYAKDANGETWSGALGGRLFELRARAAPGCSDGMSDQIYPIAVALAVNGEQRSGCAEPR